MLDLTTVMAERPTAPRELSNALGVAIHRCMSETPPDPTVFDLFTGFFMVGVCGFGGVLPWARRMIVEQRKWLTPAEFTEMLGLCSFLPGGNIMNVTIALGSRFRGIAGAAACFLGLMTAPVACRNFSAWSIRATGSSVDSAFA